MVILVDSNSSHSFMNISLASLLYGMSTTLRPVMVQDTNGHIIQVRLFNVIMNSNKQSGLFSVRTLPLILRFWHNLIVI
jgi:hypothetical protein